MKAQTSNNRAFCVLLAFVAGTAAAQDYLPDANRTPGYVDRTATVDKICRTPNYSRTVRPKTSRTTPIKVALLEGRDPRLYELDHRVPLCAGGHPTDARNLWLQPRKGQWAARYKDQLETSVCRQLCRGDITLDEAQAIFLRPDWTVEYDRYFR
jgi:hypothetical protein